MKVAVPKEILTDECRVALVPESVAGLKKAGLEVLVESGAGDKAFFTDDQYRQAGASVLPDASSLFSQAEVVLKVRPPVRNESLNAHEADLMPEGCWYVGFLYPLANLPAVRAFAARKITALGMDAIPRIARAQSMDALSSQSSLSGYQAVLLGAHRLGKYMPMMMTAAGTTPPSRVLVIGAGVAGLQSIATARRLGAAVEAFDVRPVVKEQVQSLGATFLELDAVQEKTETAGGYAAQVSADTQQREQELLRKHLRQADIVISTALIPGRKAPILINKEMVGEMKPGAVIVDVAAEAGGNCEWTQPGQEVLVNGVLVCGPLNLPSAVPIHASQMYSRNITRLLLHVLKDGRLNFDPNDPIAKACCITHEGEVLHQETKAALQSR